MGKKKKGKKKKKKAEEIPKEPSPYEKWSLEEMKEELGKLNKRLGKKQLERNYVQLERDTINQFFEITKREREELELQILTKDREMEQLEENHRVEVRVYVQKVKHLEYEHKNSSKKVKRDGESSLEDEHEASVRREVELKRLKKSLKLELTERELANEFQIAEWKQKHAKNLGKLREEFNHNIELLEGKYQDKLVALKRDLELRRKVEVHEIEERKNLHINDLMRNHEAAFGQIKDYYNDITHDNLTLIKKLQNEVKDMKQKRLTNQKLMADIAQENKQLLEPLKVAVKQVEDLRRDLKDYEKDKLSLKNAKARLKLLSSRFERLQENHNGLDGKVTATDSERQTLLEKFESTVKQVQRKSQVKNIQLQQLLERRAHDYDTRKQQLDEVVRAARLDPAVLNAVTSKLDDVIGARNSLINDLQYQVAKVGKSYNDALRTLDSKLEEFGIPPEDTGFQPLQTTQTSTLPAGLVTSKK
jgi:growth arrest-specific protein 8